MTQAERPFCELRRSVSYWLRIVLYAASFSGPLLTPLQAQTVDFDPPAFTSGQVVTTVGDATFLDNPVVFMPTQTTTFTPPNALHSAQSCTDNPCSSGAYMLRINFSKPMSVVSLRAGSYGATNPNVCIPENDLCVVNARLIGYDAPQLSNSSTPQGNAISDSGDVNIGNYVSGPITTEVKTQDLCGRIQSVILFVGKGIISPPDGGPARAQIDHFTYKVAHNPTCTTHPPPSINITSPQSQQSFSYPYQVTFAGTVTAPGGLFAFCTQINNTAMPPESQCNQKSLLSTNGNFNISLQLTSLQPGTNILSAFAYDLSGQSGSASVTMSLENPPVPTVTILEPTAGQQFGSSSGITELGEMMVPGELLAFCTGANESTPPTLNQCNQTNSVSFFPSTGQGFFNYVPVPSAMLLPGVNILDAWVFDRWGQLGQAHVTVILPADPRVIGMEVTQGIQTMSIPLNTPGTPVPYSGVKLYFGGKTVVRVFANTPAGVLPDVPAFLWATQGTGSQTQLLGLVFPDNGPQSLTPGSTTVSDAQRADPNGGYVFTLPWPFDPHGLCMPWQSCISATNGPLTLYAVLYSSGDFPPASLCPGCSSNSMMTLTNVSFTNVGVVNVSPVMVTWTGPDGVMHGPNADPNVVFSPTGNIFPPGSNNLGVFPYLGTTDVTDLVTKAISQGKTNGWLRSAVLARISNFGNNNPVGQLVGVTDSAGSPVDVNGNVLVDLGLTSIFLYGIPPRLAFNSIVTENRPLTSVTHELLHQFYYFHAGTACKINEVFPAEHWPPDERGDIQGIGLDRSVETNGTYRIIVPGAQDQLTLTSDGLQPCPAPPRTEIFDYMSYCACPDETDTWTSVPNWNAWGSTYPNGVIPCGLEGCSTAVINEGSVPAGQQTLRVVAFQDDTGAVTIHSIEPGNGKHTLTSFNSTDQTNYNFVVRDSSGQVVSRTHITPLVSHQQILLDAEVLSTAAARLEIEHNGAVVAARNRSANAPTITLLAPAAGTRLSGSSPTIVKWQAQDADGDPIFVDVDYSTDDGKTYRLLTTGATANSVSLPASFFSRAREARIRVRANDGFNESLAVSGRLSAEGTPPVVRILEPTTGTHVRNDVALRLVGTAFSDEGKPLPPKTMKWYVGGRVLSDVSQLSVFLHQPGHWTIRLVVHDDDREATASTDVFVDAVAPVFMGLRVPPVVDHAEDEMHLTVGSSIPGIVVIGDHGYPVGNKPRDITVPISKGKEDLTLPIVLVAGGKTSTFVAHIKRD